MKYCICCMYYSTLVSASNKKGEENLLGSGKCFLNPPLLLVVNNAIVQSQPTVEGNDFCSYFVPREQ